MTEKWYICTDAKRLPGKLTVGRLYRAITSSDGISVNGVIKPAIVVKCDDKVERWYPLERFDRVCESCGDAMDVNRKEDWCPACY